MNNKLSTILALALMIGIISGLGFASILLRAESAKASNSDYGDGGGEDKGSKSNDNNDNSGDDKKSDDKKQEKETKDEGPKEEDKSDSGNSENTKVSEDKKESDDDRDYSDIIDGVDVRDQLKGTSEEQEQAAVEDYVNEEPGEKQPVKGDGPRFEKCKEQSGGPHNTDYCEKKGPSNPFEPKKEIKKVWCNEYGWKSSCPPKKKPEGGGGIHCDSKYGGCGQGWPPQHKPNGNGGEDDWCKKHKCGKDGHHDDDNKHHHNWCDHNHCGHHHHHSSTHTSDNHNGDVTVKINLKYKEKNPKNLDNVELIIGDVYDKTKDLSDKPDTIKVEHLDIDGGDDFAVCLANEDSQDGQCTVTEADSDHDNVEVWLDVK